MKAFLFVSLCALVVLHESVANEIIGRFESSSTSSTSSSTTVKGHTHSSSSTTTTKILTSWEVKPDGTCIKRVVEQENGVTVEDSTLPIDCAKARQEVRDQTRVQFTNEILSLRSQQDTITNLHAAFLRKTESDLTAMQNLLKLLTTV